MPCLSLFFDSGLSSPGLICCCAMSLRYCYVFELWILFLKLGQRGELKHSNKIVKCDK